MNCEICSKSTNNPARITVVTDHETLTLDTVCEDCAAKILDICPPWAGSRDTLETDPDDMPFPYTPQERSAIAGIHNYISDMDISVESREHLRDLVNNLIDTIKDNTIIQVVRFDAQLFKPLLDSMDEAQIEQILMKGLTQQ